MLIARWQIDARFGYKQKVIDMLRDWSRSIAPQIGLDGNKGRIMTGSIGALEATVVHEWPVEDLSELDRAWTKLGTLEAHKKWGQDLEPFVVSGSSRWDIYRLV